MLDNVRIKLTAPGESQFLANAIITFILDNRTRYNITIIFSIRNVSLKLWLVSTEYH